MTEKGVESIKSRVVNLREIQPQLDLEQMKLKLTDEFCKTYLEDRFSVLVTEDVSESLAWSIPEVKKIVDELMNPEFIFNKKSDFQNSFERKFVWGLVELNFDVEAGKVSQCQIYSDCLVPEFIERVQNFFKENSIEYSRIGFGKLQSLSLDGLESDCRGFLKDLIIFIQESLE